MNDIVVLNNRAISHLRQDQVKMAIAYLYEAIRRLRKRFSHLRERNVGGALRSEREACNRLSQRPIQRCKHQEQGSIVISKIPITKQQSQQQQQPRRRSAPSSPSRSTDNLFDFYQQTFIMIPPTTKTATKASSSSSPPTKTLGSGDEKNTETISVDKQKLATRLYLVILYNIGLAFHKEGISSSGGKQKVMKALQFYEQVMSIIAIDWKEIDSEDLLLLLATSNNLGHIHSYLKNFSETQKFLIWLRHLMKACQQCNRIYGSNIISDQDYSFFFTNNWVFLKDLQELSCAPTA